MLVEIVPEQNFAVLADLVVGPLIVQKNFAEVLIGHLLQAH